MIDLYDCDPDLIQDSAHIRQFVEELCLTLGFRRFGECNIVHFGERAEIAGYSMTQLIETSLVSAHFVNEAKSIYLDIFSCKQYDSDLAASIASRSFKASSFSVKVSLRH
ncbi:S-adenosylmethionine decarboxylase [Nocardia asteroides]|uniref:S-adenosylmethionine decarboxylase n=1 Tax=Nocardia asteroides TaxID=1824 RepID=UPI003B3AFE6C